jgi:alkanesulfonate monooxygenase SsuD/methylene tetrahydromethanopterin reductase-like flavin-dependent oxidoreductase (luciferase family)
VTFEGQQYQLPYQGPGATGQGKALMSITHPLRREIPVFLGAEGPKNVELAATSFDGWFPFMMPPDRFDIYGDSLAKAKPGFEVLQSVSFSLTADPVAALLPIKKTLALYIGGMGSKEENFHKRVVERAGYAEAAQKIQDLWLAGRQQEAVMAVPDELADALSLVGSRDELRAKLARWRQSPATTLLIGLGGSFDETVRNMEVLAAEAA